MSWFNSWTDFTKKASEVAKQAADKSKVVASSVHDKVNKFVEEQKKEYNAVEHESDLHRRQNAKKDQMMQAGHSPWWIDSDTNAQQLELYDELKVNILKLCEDHNNFLIKAPSSSSVFQFDLEYALPYAHCALDQDPILPQIRFKLVPRKLNEEQFWKNYFYRVNVIRESLGIAKLDFSIPPIPSTSHTPSASATDTKEEITESKDKEASHSRSKSKNEVIEPPTDELKMDLSNSNLMPSSEHITEMANDIDDLNEDEDFLADDVHIDALSAKEKAKMKKELGIDGINDVDVDDLLAEVGADGLQDMDMSDGELAAELENM
eukprot:225838_1